MTKGKARLRARAGGFVILILWAGALSIHAQTPGTNGLEAVAIDDVPPIGNFLYLAQPDAGPIPIFTFAGTHLPVAIYRLPGDPFGYLVDDSAIDPSTAWAQIAADLASSQSTRMSASDDLSPPGEGGSGGQTGDNNNWPPAYNYPTNSFFLEIIAPLASTNFDHVDVVLHGTQPGHIYELRRKISLADAAWQTEQAVHAASDQAFTAITVPVLDRTNTLLLSARDWTGADENANRVLDYWEWENFGSLNEPTNADYDGDLLSNLAEYLAGTDPNTIEFFLAPAQESVGATSALVHVNVSSGCPASIALLLDNTNFSAATWNAYTATPAVPLGSAEGWHEVWIGLRGRLLTSEQTWHSTRVKLDLTPPLLVITNPPSTTLTRPVVQIQGYSAEDLASITYDLVNPSGTNSGEVAAIVGKTFSTNTWESTTNYFQCYDVGLTPGTNSLTLHATDRAGNTSATNLLLTVDYSGATNPPIIRLGWPLDGTQVSGDTFTWRGWLDDPTATVAAQVIDTNGNRDVTLGSVGRNGDFRIDLVPLIDGTNLLSVFSTNCAGLVSVTNVSIIKSPVTLKINATSWWGADGTMSDSGYTIWVNGTQAALNGGSWHADLSQDLAHTIIQARAIPNSDSGGQGTPSGHPEGAGVDTAANPTSNQAVDTESELEWPNSGVYVSSYHEFFDDFGKANSWDDTIYHLSHERNDWEEGGGGSGDFFADLCPGLPPWRTPTDDHYVWPPSHWPQYVDGVAHSGLPDHPDRSEPPPVRVVITPGCDAPAFHDHWDYKLPDRSYAQSYSEQSEVMVVVSGRPSSTEDRLLMFTAYGAYSFPPVGPWYEPSFTNAYPPEIKIGNFGYPGPDGILFAKRHAGTVDSGTPTPTARPTSRAAVGLASYVLVSETVATVPKDRARTNLGVGEQVKLYFRPDLPTWVMLTWSTTAGSIVTSNYNRFVGWLTAPSNASPVIVKANFPGFTFEKGFTVFEPSGVHHAVSVEPRCYTQGQAGAGMHIRPYVGPTNVSFYRVLLMEVGQPATGANGYFTNSTHPAPPHDFAAGADHFDIQLAQDNSWPVSYDQAYSPVFPPSTWNPTTWAPGGGFIWHVPAKWKVGNGPTNELSGSWDQVFTLATDGTVTVTKFGLTATRNTGQNCSVISGNR